MFVFCLKFRSMPPLPQIHNILSLSFCPLYSIRCIWTKCVCPFLFDRKMHINSVLSRPSDKFISTYSFRALHCQVFAPSSIQHIILFLHLSCVNAVRIFAYAICFCLHLQSFIASSSLNYFFRLSISNYFS